MRGSSPQGLPSAIRRGAELLTCDPGHKSPFGIGLMLLLGVFTSALPWAYHHLIIPVWGYLDPNNVPGPTGMVWAGIGSVTIILVQGASAIFTSWNKRKQEEADANRKAAQEEAEAERQFKREQLEAERKTGRAELQRQLDDVKQDMDRVAREAQQKVDDAARELKRRDDQAEAERCLLAAEKEALKLRVSELEKTVPPIEAKTAAVAGRVDALQCEALKQNVLPKADPQRPPDAPKPTVVIAEDNPGAVQVLSRLILANGFDPRTAVTLHDALSLVALGPHFAVVDLRLGGEDGMEIVRAIQAKGSQTEIIIYTGAGDERLDRAKEAVGAERVIEKGSQDSDKQLIALLKKIMEDRRRNAGA
jgi:ActR/RegA family two-component response regulator